MMKIVMPGGSGQVGRVLARAFVRDGHDVVVLSRRPSVQPWRVEAWDGATVGSWGRAHDGADVVINLAGRSVNCRYTAANRRDILESRVRSTQAVGEAIAQCACPPRVWLQASTATIYAHRYDAANDERSGKLGGEECDAPEAWRFSIDVARAWEKALREAPVTSTRKVLLRSAVTMSPDAGGPFDVLLALVRHGLGGPTGNGRQFVSWVHHEDVVRAVRWLIHHDEVEGVVNVASPEPLPNAEFMRVLRHAWGASIGLPARGWMLDLGAVLMRTETELVLKSRRVAPARLLDAGFEFHYPRWADAARNLVASRAA
jgi:uncharacterized protein (TIGR01777 family)